MENALHLAIQRSGRLSESSLALLKECDLHFSLGKNKLRSPASNFPVEMLFLRDDDIPGYVADGVADIGIVGENVVAEKDRPVEIIEKLGFSKCRLSIAVPNSFKFKTLQDLHDCHIATSHPKILTNFLSREKITAKIHEISGSVEIAPGIGLSDAICDVVSSGSTLVGNGLKEVKTIFNSEAVLIANPELSKEKNSFLNRLLFRIRSVIKAKDYQYILMNIPNEAIDKVVQILPGMKSPTVMPLSTGGWSSVHSVIRKDTFWEIIDNLQAAGAQGILVVPIEKMII